VKINGALHYLWRAVEQDDDVISVTFFISPFEIPCSLRYE